MLRPLHVTVLLSAIGATSLAAEDSEWRSLPLIENGKVADEWKFIGFGSFEIVEHAIRTVPDARGLGLLVYEKEKFGDCQIRVVFRTENPRSNAGVYIRIDDGILDAKQPPPAARSADGKLTEAGLAAMQEASEKDLGPWYAVHHGYEVQICDAADPWHRTGSIYSLVKSDAPAKSSPGTWRTMTITLRGDQVQVEVDGKRAASFDPSSPSLPERKQWHEPKREPERPRAGYIGLQTHDPGDVVDFREVSVRKLDDAD